MSDDGGSTGILRDEMGALPPGDVRQCLVALSPQSHLMRELLNYRFEDGQLEGHAFGNLFLTALEQIGGSFEEAVKTAEQILSINGRVIPVTTDDVRLRLTTKHTDVIGEKHVIETEFSQEDQPRLSLEPSARINPDAIEAITAADMIVIGPGNLYGSLIPNLLVDGMQQALTNSSARKVLVANLVNKASQTDGFMVHDYIDTLEQYITPSFFDYTVYCNRKPSDRLLAKYAKDGETWVECDTSELDGRETVGIGADLLSSAQIQTSKGDTLIDRNLIRHDSTQLARELMKIYFS